MPLSYEDDFEYAKHKIVGSVVRLGEKLVRVDKVDTLTGEVYCRVFPEHNLISCELKELNLEPFPLGYFNYEGDALYSRRLPSRQWKQGVRKENCQITSHVNLGKFIPNSAFEQALLQLYTNHYQNKQVCLEKIANGEATSLAFHRNFSVATPKFTLRYRGNVIGGLNPDNGEAIVQPKFNFLQKVLEESNV